MTYSINLKIRRNKTSHKRESKGRQKSNEGHAVVFYKGNLLNQKRKTVCTQQSY